MNKKTKTFRVNKKLSDFLREMKKFSKNNQKLNWRVEGQMLIVEGDLPVTVEDRIREITNEVFEVEQPRYELRVDGNVIGPRLRDDDDTNT